jgi:1-acyl-sn-glycerol-3-phosphate acyltransferase
MATEGIAYMGSWQYAPAADLHQPLRERLRRFPREPDLMIYGLRSTAAVILRAWLRLYHRLRIEGAENLPQDQSFVLVANHSSHLDTLCLLSALPLWKLHRAFPAAAQDYFFVKARRLALAAIAVNALPFARQCHVRHSLDLCRELLSNRGNILILFPEGTRTRNGQIGEFKPGIGALVAGSDIPVVPCHLNGTFEAWPKGKWFPRPRAVRLAIGQPRTYATLDPGREASDQICRELRHAVIALSRKETEYETD